MSLLTVLDQLPEALLTARAAELYRHLSGPTLIHLPGRRDEPLFVSILLHGNEDVGLLAVQQLLRELGSQPLPRAMSLFIGNVAAASKGVRRFDDQVDYNRVWPGGSDGATAEHAMMRQIVCEMERRRVFASVDLHNNTGLNPHYACVSRLDPRHIGLAALFSRTVVYFRVPKGVQTMAFASLCPAVTCECGKVGDTAGAERAAAFLRDSLHLAEICPHPNTAGDVHLFHTVARVVVPPEVTFSFSHQDADLQFSPNLEKLNFQELPAGTCVARRRPGARATLAAHDEGGGDASGEFFLIDSDSIRLRKPVMPSMLTTNAQVIRQDCLCYFMERHPLPAN